MQITAFPDSPDANWLYYFALQVNFALPGEDEWSHGGIQWVSAFAKSGNKGVNWGGGAKWAGYGGIGVNNTPFIWQPDTWYRLRVWKGDKDTNGLQHWLFAVMNYQTSDEQTFGSVRTKSEWIKSAMVWMETGYGVQCDTLTARAEWRNPRFRTPKGVSAPQTGTANYNGTCADPNNTNQYLITTTPHPYWCQETNVMRSVNPNTRLW